MNPSDKPFLPRIEAFLDCNGKVLEFELTQGPQTDGVLVSARQVNPETAPGYEFSAWSFGIGDALGKLRLKIRAGISRRYLATHPERGLQLLTFGFKGVVGSGGVTIDGRHVPFDWLVTELQAFEGWDIELQIKDGSE
jgi:hypothetical protein